VRDKQIGSGSRKVPLPSGTGALMIWDNARRLIVRERDFLLGREGAADLVIGLSPFLERLRRQRAR
jgi:hypothetical protein